MRKAQKREILDCINSLHQEIREASERETIEKRSALGTSPALPARITLFKYIC